MGTVFCLNKGKMMKKNIMFVSAFCMMMTSMAFAHLVPYVGTSSGIIVNTSTGVAENNGKNTTTGKTIISGSPAFYRGIPFNLFAGYGGVINENYYLSGELTGTIGSVSISDAAGLKTTYGYSVSVLPGLMITDNTLAFVRLGVAGSHFSNINQMATGVQVGVGMQSNLLQNLDLRGEYAYVAYPSLNNKVGGVGAPRSDQFLLGIIYKFE